MAAMMRLMVYVLMRRKGSRLGITDPMFAVNSVVPCSARKSPEVSTSTRLR